MTMTSSDRISLIDGAGSQATLRFIRTEILSRFGNPILNPLEDASWISFQGDQLIVTTDAYVVDPPIFPGGNIGRLAVAGTVNDLIASGAQPHYLTLGLVIAEGMTFDTLRLILDSVAKTAQEAEVQVVAGDTKVVEEKVGSFFIHSTGLGVPIRPTCDYATSKAQVGDKVIVTGTLGDHGFAILSFREGLGFEQRVQSDCAPLHELLLPVLKRFDQIRCLRDPTRGGLISALLDIAEGSKADIVACRDDIPVKPEVAYGCEMLGLDPLQLVNEGKMVLVIGAGEADAVVAMLREHPLGQQAVIIGEIFAPEGDTGRLLFREENTARVIIRPEGMAVPRLC